MSNIIFITARCEYDIKLPAPEVPHLARPPYQPQQSTRQSYVATRLADFLAVLFYLCHVNKTISDGGITVDFWFIKVHTSN